MLRKLIYGLVIAIGFLQIIGYLTQQKTIRGLGAVSASSPLPIVFTEVKGVETFASDFYVQYRNPQGEIEKIKMTPEMYSKFKGPYNRRNIYGAAIAYGPVLPKPLWQSVLNYGLCNDVLKNELQLPVSKQGFSIVIETRTAGREDHWELNANCEE